MTPVIQSTKGIPLNGILFIPDKVAHFLCRTTMYKGNESLPIQKYNILDICRVVRSQHTHGVKFDLLGL